MKLERGDAHTSIVRWRSVALVVGVSCGALSACTNSSGSIPETTPSASGTAATIDDPNATVEETAADTVVATTTVSTLPPTTIPHGGGVIGTLANGEPMPEPALSTAKQVYEAAIRHDYATLKTVIGDRRFRWGFVGERGPTEEWKRLFDETGQDELARLVRLLDTPASIEKDGDIVWPALSTKPVEEWTAEDEALLASFGFNPEDIQQTKVKGRYVDYRVIIGPDGIWKAFGVGW